MKTVGPLRLRLSTGGLLLVVGDQQAMLEGQKPMELLEWLYQHREELHQLAHAASDRKEVPMSDVDITIRQCIQELMTSQKEVTVEAVQKALIDHPFFTSRGITLVPAEWIEPVMDDEIALSTGPYQD